MSPLERALALLEPSLRPDRADVPRGYLDLLGDDAPPVRTVSQRLMRATPLVAVYERWWRPGLGKLLTGLGPGPDEERRMACAMLDLGAGDGVLDVACGTGAFTRAFAGVVGPDGLAVGLDASAPMLARAAVEDRAGAAAWIRGDAAAMPFVDASFDAVCCFAALYLVDDVDGTLDEIARVLTPGGRVAILTSARPAPWPLRLVDRPAALAAGVRMFDRDEITTALERRGFEDVSVRFSGLAQFVAGRRV